MKMLKKMGGNIPGGNILGENFPGGNSPGESLIGGNFPGGSFPDTEENICKKFTSVHAFTLIFIRKISFSKPIASMFSPLPIIIFSMMVKYFVIL